MNWPNKIALPEPKPTERFIFYRNMQGLEKWCLDNISSRDVLWKLRMENIGGVDIWHFFFAQSQDAVMFRLVNGV